MTCQLIIKAFMPSCVTDTEEVGNVLTTFNMLSAKMGRTDKHPGVIVNHVRQ